MRYFLALSLVWILASPRLGGGGGAPGSAGLPAGCTDNTIARADGVAGATQCSGATINDSDSFVTSGGFTGSAFNVNDSNVRITETGTNDLAFTSDGAVGLTLSGGAAPVLAFPNTATLAFSDGTTNLFTFNDSGSVGVFSAEYGDFNFIRPKTANGNLIIEDQAGNDLVTITDNGTTGSLSSVGAVGSGGTVNGIETDYAVADVVATDTTPVDVTGISFTLAANDVYSISCSGLTKAAVAASAPQMGFDIPADAAIELGCDHAGLSSGGITTDDGACAIGASTTGGNIFNVHAVVTMVTGGAAQLRLRSETTDDVTILAGYRCSAKKTDDN